MWRNSLAGLAALVIVPALASTSPTGGHKRPQLTKTLRQQLTELVARKANWKSNEMRLAWAKQWDHTLVPIVMAHPTINLPHSVPVALLAERRLTPYDSDALATLLRERLPSPGTEQAAAVAQLALWFGDFGAPVGELAVTLPVSLRQRLRSPPADTAPRLRADGERIHVRFYSVDHELGRVYDCRVEMRTGAVNLRAELLK